MPHTLLQLSVILIYKSLFLYFSYQEKYDPMMISSPQLPHLYLQMKILSETQNLIERQT